MRETHTTLRDDDEYGFSVGVTTYPNDDAPPKIGVWTIDSAGRTECRVLGFRLTADTLTELSGGEGTQITTSKRVFDLIRDAVEESDATMPDYE